MKKLALGVALAAMLAMPLNAMAAYYTLNVGQIQAMTVFFTDGDAGSQHTAQTNASYGAKFSGTVRNNNPGYGFVEYAYDLGGADLSAYDGVGLCFENVNENPWDLWVLAWDGSATSVFGVQTAVPLNTPLCLTADFASNGAFDATDVHEIAWAVAGDVPLGNLQDDYVYEVRVAPLPEPGTLALFGFGLAGAAASYRRKRAAKKA